MKKKKGLGKEFCGVFDQIIKTIKANPNILSMSFEVIVTVPFKRKPNKFFNKLRFIKEDLFQVLSELEIGPTIQQFPQKDYI